MAPFYVYLFCVLQYVTIQCNQQQIQDVGICESMAMVRPFHGATALLVNIRSFLVKLRSIFIQCLKGILFNMDVNVTHPILASFYTFILFFVAKQLISVLAFL